MRNILIQGIDTLLGSYFAARCLQMPDDQAFYLPDANESLLGEEITDFVSHAACQIDEGGATVRNSGEIARRLHRVGRDLPVHAPGRIAAPIDEVWYFANTRDSPSQMEMIKGLIAACPTMGARDFNYVGFDNGVVELTGKTPDQEIRRLCKAQNIGQRVFQTSLIVGNGHPKLKQSGVAVVQFLAVLHSFKAEIEERSPQYFDFHALRCLAPRDAAMNLVPATVASDLLLRIARTDGTTGSIFSISSPEDTPFSALCERIGVAYSLGLLWVEDFDSLNAIDRVFHERSSGLYGHRVDGAPKSPPTDTYRAAGLSLDNAPFGEEAQIALFESLRRNQDQARVAGRQRVADLQGRLVNKAFTRDGFDLHYYVGGTTGSVVVLLNALGQGLECWRRLMDNLMQNYRVIIWETRGTVSPPPPFGLTDQVDDLDAILQHEGVETCHLVGWCTSPKVAIDFHLRRPSVVRSMAFLNGTFKCKGSPEGLNSPYEQSLESLFRMLVRKPAMAASIMKNLGSRVEESEIDMLEGPDGEQMSVSVLSRMNAELKSSVLEPFKTEETTLNYAHQLIDFWSHDSRPKAGGVRIPVLLMGAEYDQVTTPAASQMAAGLFPNARHVHVSGATHYCLYDRAEFVGGLLKTFFENPDNFPLAQPVQDEVAQAQ